MQQVLFVTNAYHTTPLYSELQQRYAITSQGVASTLRMAATLLQAGENEDIPTAVIFGPDLLPPTQTVQFIRKAINIPKLRPVKWIVLLDANVAFTGSDLAGVATSLIFQDVTADSLGAILEAQPVKIGHTTALTIVNTKGGTGKTTLIVNLADALARRNLKTVVLDADVADGNVGLALGAPPSAPTIDKLAGEIARGQDPGRLMSKYLYERGSNLYVLPAPDRRDYGQDNLNEVTAAAIFNALTAQRFDIVLVDLPGNVRATPFVTVLVGCSTAYFYILYTVGQSFGVKGFDGATQIVGGLGGRERTRMVIQEGREADAWSEAELGRAWQMPIAGKLPYDPLIERSQAAGQTIAEYMAAQKGLTAQVSRGLSRLGGRDYRTAVENLADWIIKNDLHG